jgi:UDP-glucose:(heptosyl)LPS alpha-1,3-glucosyltransferase
LFVGADFKRKGLDTLFKAFSLLDIRDTKLIIAGRPAKTCYVSMAKKLGIDKNVIFRGAEKEIEKLYSVADVFVLPTIYDPFSNATLEAMASGLPVITTAYNGASELIEDGIEGFVINNPLDADALAQKISTTLQQAEDMGKKARLRAEGHSVKKAVDKIIKVISVHSR